MSEPKEREILYQGLNWHIGVDGCYINTKEKEPVLNHLYEVALACKSKSDQLTAKEQECEELNKTITNLENIRDDFSAKLDQLKAELEQEKSWHKTSDEISKVNSEYTAKLKQILTEIKEIAEAESYLSPQSTRLLVHKILQKISEVIKDEE